MRRNNAFQIDWNPTLLVCGRKDKQTLAEFMDSGFYSEQLGRITLLLALLDSITEPQLPVDSCECQGKCDSKRVKPLRAKHLTHVP